MKKKADLTNKATPSSVANILNPFSTFTGGETWAPKAVANAPSDSKDREVVYKAIVGFLGAGALAAAVRSYVATQQSASGEYTKDISKLPRPTTEAPVGEEDLERAAKGELTDSEMNLDRLATALPGAAVSAYRGAKKGWNTLNQKGAEFEAALPGVYANVHQAAKKGLQTIGQEGSKLVRGFRKDATDGRWAQLALPVAGVSAGALLGYNIVDAVSEDIDKTRLTTATAKKEALLRRLTAARALNARGMLDDTTYNKMMDQVTPYMPAESVVKTASEKRANWFTEPVGRMYGLAGALLATSFAVSAYISKRQTDANDPARIKMKAYQEGLKQYANEKMLQSPVLMGTPGKSVLEALDNNIEPAALPATDYAPRSPVSIPM